MNPIEFKLTLPNHPGGLAPALAFVDELARGAGFVGAEASGIRLALEEALTNVLTHGFEPGEQATFELICAQHPTSLVFTIREKGQPFDPARVPVYEPDALSDGASTAGLGTFLLRQVMDEVDFRNLGRDGKELRLTKYMPLKRATDREHGPDAIAPHSQTASAQASLRIRPLEPEDVIEVSRCAYRAYGYSYEDYIYRPDRIAQMNADGILQSLVAVTEDGRIGGHVALKRTAADDAIAEIGVAFVKPEFRAHGTFLDLTNAAIAAAREAGLYGVFVRAVTSHAISQKTAWKFGFRACNLMLALFPSDVDFKQLTGRIVQKESGLSLFLPLRPFEPRTVYVPPQHLDHIRVLYDTLGIPVQLTDVPGGVRPPEGETKLTTTTIEEMNATDIRLEHCGADARQAVRRRLRALCLERRDAIYLHLDPEDAASASMVSAFEDMGFFFSGILPRGLAGRDALILQYMNNIAIDYDKIKLFSDDATKLLAYVRQHDPGTVE